MGICQHNSIERLVDLCLHHKVILDWKCQFTNQIHLREFLIFCFNMKKSAAEAHRMLSNTYGEAGFDVEDRHSGGREKMQNWRHYLNKTRVKIKKNWHDHWEWLNKPFQNASKSWEWFRSKEIGCRTNWSREMLNRVCLLVNSCLKGKDGRDFCIVIVTGDEKWVHYDNPKCRKSWGVPGHASTSTAKPNIHSSKIT